MTRPDAEDLAALLAASESPLAAAEWIVLRRDGSLAAVRADAPESDPLPLMDEIGPDRAPHSLWRRFPAPSSVTDEGAAGRRELISELRAAATQAREDEATRDGHDDMALTDFAALAELLDRAIAALEGR